jgi:hypothetical protein
MTARSIARLKITLNGVKPPVRRRIEVPLSIRLDRLHLVFQAAPSLPMGMDKQPSLRDPWARTRPGHAGAGCR